MLLAHKAQQEHRRQPGGDRHDGLEHGELQ
jgi:hypothetical protein